MDRRNISTALIACATGAALLPRNVRAQTCTPPCYAQTAAEKAAGVTPTNYDYPPGNVLRYGADPSGVSDSTTAINNACASNNGGEVYLPAGTYLVSSTPPAGSAIKLPTHVNFHGDSMNGTVINYNTSTGIAVDGYPNSTSYSTIHDLTINCVQNNNIGLRLGGGGSTGCRQVELRNLLIQGQVTGATDSEGINLNSAAPGKYSGGVTLVNVNVVGFWKGLHALSNSATNTWTTINGYNCFFTSTGPLSGSIGIHFDNYTNGTGSRFLGGTIEGFATGIQVDNPAVAGVGFGLDWDGDIEGNTAAFSVGTAFAYGIHNAPTLSVQALNVQVPTTGFRIFLPQWPRVTKLHPTGTLASGTITLPATPYDGMEVRVISTQTVTSLTVNTGTGTIVGAPSTIMPTTPFGMVYDAINGEWSRLQ